MSQRQFISADDMILYPKDPNNSTKHLDLINTFSELAEYKIKMQNLEVFLYISSLRKIPGKKS